MAVRLAMSQIAWQAEQEGEALAILRREGFSCLEIAPPRVAGPAPYDNVDAAAEYAAQLRREHGLSICSMQSIWFGQSGSLFGPERQALLEYTQKAMKFANACGAQNLVFGCPKNRVLPPEGDEAEADRFFKELGDEAAAYGVVLALEPNPPIYGTNFINTTPQAFQLVQRVNSPGFKVNLDFGTIVENGEDVGQLRGLVPLVNHVHISEPNLVMIEKRAAHGQLAALLREEGYGGVVSVEMKAQSLENVEKAAVYVREVFG